MVGTGVTTTVRVEGMTCGHCARAVQSELSAVDGVSGVEVDLGTGLVTVRSIGAIAAEAVLAAVDEAGYRVVG